MLIARLDEPLMAHESQLEEIAGHLRANTLDVLRTFASSLRTQGRYSAVVPHGLDELFCQWGDVYQPGGPAFDLAFEPRERTALADFNKVFERTSAALPDPMPEVEAFTASDASEKLAGAAAEALRALGDVR